MGMSGSGKAELDNAINYLELKDFLKMLEKMESGNWKITGIIDFNGMKLVTREDSSSL